MGPVAGCACRGKEGQQREQGWAHLMVTPIVCDVGLAGGDCLLRIRSLMGLCTFAVSLGGAALVATIPARAGTIAISYILSGTTTITGITATTAYLSGVNTGSLNTSNAAVNAVWNPVRFTYMSQADLASGLLTGAFNLTLANGEMLSGLINENLASILQSPTLTGSYPQVLTFTGGTGEFAGVSGSASGTGYVGVGGGTLSGSGTLTAPGVVTPEPACRRGRRDADSLRE
jgi:hypothetical protein